MKKNILFFILFYFLAYSAFSIEIKQVPFSETVSPVGVEINPTDISSLKNESLQNLNAGNISPSMMEALKKFFQAKLLDVQNNQQFLSSLAQEVSNNKEKIDEILKQIMVGENSEEAFNSLSRWLESIQLNPVVQKQLIKNSPGLQIVEEQLKTAFSNLDKDIDNF